MAVRVILVVHDYNVVFHQVATKPEMPELDFDKMLAGRSCN